MKTFAKRVLSACLFAAPIAPLHAEQQPAAPAAEEAAQTRAQQLMGDIAPKLAELTDEVLLPTQASAAEDAVTVERHGTQPATSGPAEHFTGSVRGDSRFQRASPARAGGGIVSFARGARTAWHSHPLGQTLIVMAGAGLVQSRGMPLEEIAPGDVVWIPPRVKHWHGATKSSEMAHIAIVEALDGKTADWMEQVTEAQYAGKPAE